MPLSVKFAPRCLDQDLKYFSGNKDHTGIALWFTSQASLKKQS